MDEAWNKGNLDVLDELHSADCIEHQSPFPDVKGLDAFKQMVAGTRKTYPDFHLTIHELILEENRLASRWTWTGTHLGQSQHLAIQPTGKQLTVIGLHILHFEKEKLVEGWNFADVLGVMKQLGLVPQLG